MTVEERRKKVRILYRTGKFTQKTLAGMFGVSKRTIRNDLENRPEGPGRSRGHDHIRLSPEATARIIELLTVETERKTMGEIAIRARLSDRTLTRVLNDSPACMTLALADDIVTRLWSPLRWISDPVLSEWYLTDRGWRQAA